MSAFRLTVFDPPIGLDVSLSVQMVVLRWLGSLLMEVALGVASSDLPEASPRSSSLEFLEASQASSSMDFLEV